MGAIYFPNSIEHAMPPSGTTSEGLSRRIRGTYGATAQTSLAGKQARTITPADAIGAKFRSAYPNSVDVLGNSGC
jgi:hypothetical protein